MVIRQTIVYFQYYASQYYHDDETYYNNRCWWIAPDYPLRDPELILRNFSKNNIDNCNFINLIGVYIYIYISNI